MITTILAAGAPAAAEANPYGLGAALREGGLISQSVFSILVLMSIVSFYILFSKLFEQQKIMNQAKRVRQQFWQSNNLRGDAKRATATAVMITLSGIGGIYSSLVFRQQVRHFLSGVKRPPKHQQTMQTSRAPRLIMLCHTGRP